MYTKKKYNILCFSPLTNHILQGILLLREKRERLPKTKERNMTKEQTKKALDMAKKEVQEEAIKALKEVIKTTIKKRESLITRKKDLLEKISILDKDLADLKEGRLDRIEDRQKKDPFAKSISVVGIERRVEEHHHHHRYIDDRWYWPYQVTWQYPVCTPGTGQFLSTQYTSTTGVTDATYGNFCASFEINNSIAKDNAQGAYDIYGNGQNVKYL